MKKRIDMSKTIQNEKIIKAIKETLTVWQENSLNAGQIFIVITMILSILRTKNQIKEILENIRKGVLEVSEKEINIMLNLMK